MKRLATALILINVLACGSESKDSGANLVAESETTTTDTETTKETDTTKTTETETDTMDPDAYPIAEGFTKIAVSEYRPDGPAMTWFVEFDVDFQCTGAIEIRGEIVLNKKLYWVSYTVASQPASWVSGYQVSERKQYEHAEDAAGYNNQSRVLYKCL